MPGEESLLKEFVDKNLSATPELRLLGQLVRHVFEAMKLAGEAGSLLKIETEIANAVAEAKRKWLEAPTPKQDILFAEMAKPEQQQLGYEVAGITDEAFWERAEKLIYDALQAYAEQSENGGGYQRRLFADDVARGFSFIDLCRKRYDVVLMNPPYGAGTSNADIYWQRTYPRSKADLYAAFIERACEISHKEGLVGALTDRMFLILPSFSALRREFLLENNPIMILADLWYEVLDGAFNCTAAYVIRAKHRIQDSLIFCVNLKAAKDKDVNLLKACVDPASDTEVYIHHATRFLSIPESRFSYWLPDSLLDRFEQLPQFEPDHGSIKVGLQTCDDYRFLRSRWEVPSDNRSWKMMPKGGEFSPFYCDTNLVVNWRNSAAELRAFIQDTLGRTPSRHIQNESYYGQPGLTFPNMAGSFNVQPMGAGQVFSIKGQGVFSRDPALLLTYMGYLNSLPAKWLLSSISGGHSWDSKCVASLPIPHFSSEEKQNLNKFASAAYNIRCQWEDQEEMSARFIMPRLLTLRNPSNGLIDTGDQLSEFALKCESELTRNLKQIDVECSNAIGLYDHEATLPSPDRFSDDTRVSIADYWDKNIALISGLFQWELSAEVFGLISYFVGSILGQWDIRFTTSEKQAPELPDPFAPLPVCPPGMLQNEDGLPAGPEDVPESYPLRISWPGILVDDPGHAEDIEARAREVLHVIWPEHADATEQEACEILGVRSLREYFRKPGLFFADHLKRYSKSRRQAPIYWPLATPSGSYTLWLYYHRLDAQTLYRCVVEFVEPKLRETNDALGQLRAKANRSREEERELERLQDFALELLTFRDELLRLAQLPWRPDLNDGVQITAAPLWQLFRLPKWQKTLKETWQKLEKGDYDWAHLAMTIWPERVVPKCVKDRSLAIAHVLEDLFWVEDADGWRKVKRPEQEIEEQKNRQRADARARVRLLLAKLTSEEGNLSADEVRRRLAGEEWNDREVALLLYPERVADACWENPNVARRLSIQLPARRSAAARGQFTKKLIKSGCPDIAVNLESALRDRTEPFRTLWEEMEQGYHDDFEVAIAFWPDRVVDKCAEDVSLAERHTVRQFFWCQHPTSEWRRREDPDTEVVKEIARRRGAGRREEVSA
jgi:hypothetical protein